MEEWQAGINENGSKIELKNMPTLKFVPLIQYS